ncbi:unnamed protein product, partial [Ixodes persulcatus]
MEPSPSSSRGGDTATLLENTSSLLKATEDIWFGCCSCTFVTRDQRGIVSHLAAHGDEQLKCQYPPILSGSRSQDASNTQKRKSDKLFECKLCPQAFTRCSNLRTHNQTHTGEKQFKCKLCPKAFA